MRYFTLLAVTCVGLMAAAAQAQAPVPMPTPDITPPAAMTPPSDMGDDVDRLTPAANDSAATDAAASEKKPGKHHAKGHGKGKKHAKKHGKKKGHGKKHGKKKHH